MRLVWPNGAPVREAEERGRSFMGRGRDSTSRGSENFENLDGVIGWGQVFLAVEAQE